MNQELPLRDIHLPDAVTWWPPAIGWWLLVLVIVLLIMGCWLLYKKLTRRTAVKSATEILLDLKQTENNDELAILKQLSVCIRRVSISTHSRSQTASLTGKDWLSYLDQSVEGKPFTEGVGKYLSDAPYRKEAPEGLELEALIELCEDWLKGQK